jgi:predicted phosphodiesterase
VAAQSYAANYIGVISDTHGLLRPEVLKVFDGVELIVHAGDIGDVDILEKLREIAPVVAVRRACGTIFFGLPRLVRR